MQDADRSNLSTSIRSTRLDLESDDPRHRLSAFTTLSRLCCESKAQQHAVGAFLREATPSGSRLLQIVLNDLHTSDRALRCASARLVCQLAYENLVNQESIMQLSKGFSIGWLHVFSVPTAYRSAHTPQVSSTRHQSQQQPPQRGLAAFLHELVAGNYGDVYQQVSSYYATGCTTFLPLYWRFPQPADTGQGDQKGEDPDDIPDPADHVLGFYLVPRQTQFPEQDDFFNDELLGSLDQSDLQQLQAVKTAFETVASVYSGGSDSVPTNQFVKYCETSVSDTEAPLAWLVETQETDAIASLAQYFDSTPTLTWNNVFTFSAMRLNCRKLSEMVDPTALASVSSLFRRLALTLHNHITGTTCVWSPVFVTAVQRATQLPHAFRRQVKSLVRLSSSDQSSASTEEEWRVLLRTKLEHVTPISWAVFLAQWRAAADLERQIGEQQASQPQRRTSVCSVSNIRKSIVELCKPQSFQDLDQLRRELPMVSRFASQQDLAKPSLRGLTVFHEEADESDGNEVRKATDSSSDEGSVDTDSLSYNLALFHRMQHSLAELDALSLQKIQEKQREKERVMETVALNKKRAEEEAQRKRIEVDEKHRAFEAKRLEAEQRQALARARVAAREQKKHDQATRRKQLQDEELEAKQQEIMGRIQQRDREREHRQRLDEKRISRPLQPQPLKPRSQEEPAQRVVIPTPPPPTAKRPLSARVSSSVSSANLATALRVNPDPEILRQRALLYGQVVSKIYMAEAANRDVAPAPSEPTFHQPHHLTRSFSTYGSTSFNVKAPLLKNTTPSSARSRRNLYSRALRQEEMKQMEEASRSAAPTDQPHEEQHEGEEENEHEEDGLRTRKARAAKSPVSPVNDTSLLKARDREAATLMGSGNACTTLVMRSAALAVSERIRIPDVPAPAVEDPSVPPYVIAAQYEALDDHYKRNFRERFNLKCVSHRLSFDVLKQYTKIVRRDMAWHAFHDRCPSGHSEKIKYMDFAAVAQDLGITLSEKKLLVVARQLDPSKSGYVQWKAFYTWWSVQYSDQVQSGGAAGSSPRQSQRVGK